MDDDDQDILAQDSLAATRSRRANAGSKLKSLLESEEPIDDEENIFMEHEDDQEFEVEDSEQSGEEDDQDEDEEEPEVEQEQDGEYEAKRPSKKLDNKKLDSKKLEEISHNDENFSSSSEDEESDHEREDAGEQELLKEQAEEKKRRQQEKKRKMFEIRPHLSSQDSPATKRVKKESITPRLSAEQLMSNERRVSQRSTAVKNTQDVIQRLKESEARREEIIAKMQRSGKKAVVHKKTQEERLAEVALTEEKNRASLKQFYDLEEERKQRQRAAMLAKRVPLKNIIRYVSSTRLVGPRIIFHRAPMPKNLGADSVKREEGVVTVSETPEPSESRGEDQLGSVEIKGEEDLVTMSEVQEPPAENRQDSVEVKIEEGSQAGNNVSGSEELQQSEGERSKDLASPKERHVDTFSQLPTEDQGMRTEITVEPETESQAGEQERPEEETENKKPADESNENIDQDGQRESNQDQLNDQNAQGKDQDQENNKDQESGQDQENNKDQESGQDQENNQDHENKNHENKNHENKDEEPRRMVAQGPPLLRLKNTITLLEFEDESVYSKKNTKSLLLGPQSLKSNGPQIRANTGLCIISGEKARFRDPDSHLPYANMEAFKMLKLVKQGYVAWNSDMGGAYVGMRNQRHATGVPPGF